MRFRSHSLASNERASATVTMQGPGTGLDLYDLRPGTSESLGKKM